MPGESITSWGVMLPRPEGSGPWEGAQAWEAGLWICMWNPRVLYCVWSSLLSTKSSLPVREDGTVAGGGGGISGTSRVSAAISNFIHPVLRPPWDVMGGEGEETK